MFRIDNNDFYLNDPDTKRVSPFDWNASQYIENNWFKVSMKWIGSYRNHSEFWDWIDDNIEGYYAYLIAGEMIFLNKTDAFAFKMRWC